jgi:hypothetical protein
MSVSKIPIQLVERCFHPLRAATSGSRIANTKCDLQIAPEE